MNFKLVFLFFLLFSASFSAQEELPPEVSVEVDSLVPNYGDGMLKADSILSEKYLTDNKIFPKEIQPNLRNKYKGEEYNYATIKPKESLWDRMKRRIAKILYSIFGDVDIQKTGDITFIVLRIFAIALVGFLLYFLIKYILSKNGNFLFSKKNQKVNIRDENLAENIHEINFSEEISKFERQQNYRYAVRYQFLNVLKKLSDKKLIEWLPEKTNRDYISELINSTQKEEFRELSRIFDYVWYGEFDINENNYKHFKNIFNAFKI